MVKTEEELDYLRRAEEIGAEAFGDVLPKIKVGVTENEIAAELEYPAEERRCRLHHRLYCIEFPYLSSDIHFGIHHRTSQSEGCLCRFP